VDAAEYARPNAGAHITDRSSANGALPIRAPEEGENKKYWRKWQAGVETCRKGFDWAADARIPLHMLYQIVDKLQPRLQISDPLSQKHFAHGLNSADRSITMGFRMVGIVLALLVACAALGQLNKATATGVEGVITVSPTRPGPIRAGSELPNTTPLPNATFTISSDKGPVKSFTTDTEGRFRVFLNPGHYLVLLAEDRFPRPCGPFEVDVAPGKMTDVEWRCDSGMR
jgi:hypothetical protein